MSVNLVLFSLLFFLISCTSQPITTAEMAKTAPKALSELAKKGKMLFFANCASCHNKDMVSDMTGPALYEVEKRWEHRDDLIQFIQNPQALINDNHEYAVKVSTLWPSEMTPFPNLDRIAIEAILRFVEEKGAM